MGFQAGVVQLGDGHHDPVEGLAVQGQPALHSVGVDGGDLVGDRDVGVQVGVACPGVAVGERGADQAGGVDLGDTAGAGAGEGRMGSMKANASATAASWHSSMSRATSSGATAQSADTDLTGLNVTS